MARSTDRGPDKELSKRDRPARKKPRRPPKTGHRLALGEQIEDPNEYGVRVRPLQLMPDAAHDHLASDMSRGQTQLNAVMTSDIGTRPIPGVDIVIETSANDPIRPGSPHAHAASIATFESSCMQDWLV